MNNFLRYEQQGPVVTLTMDQPETRNALTGNSAAAEFVEASARIRADASVRAVIITGAGPVFSSGGNVKDMRRFFDPGIAPHRIREEYRAGIQRMTLAVYNLDVPTIAAVNGPAIGAGCDLTCMCDIRIASERATFAESFVRVGLIPGDGGSWLLPRVVGMSRAAEMSFTGDPVDATQALAWGLVSRVVAPDQLLPEAMRLAERISANPGPVLRMTKSLLREGVLSRLDSLLEMAAGMQALAHHTAQHREAVEAIVAKRPARFSED